jgi:hypothetical protein
MTAIAGGARGRHDDVDIVSTSLNGSLMRIFLLS